MTENNLPALKITNKLYEHAEEIDSKSSALSYLYTLDQLEIYDDAIVTFYNGLCHQNIVAMVAYLALVKHGVLKPDELRKAIYSGIPSPEMAIETIKTILPDFNGAK